MTHHDYLHHLKSFFSAHADDPLIAQAQHANAREIIIFSTLDLEPARAFLESHDCPVKRRPPRDPICMLRLFLLMLLCHVKGITAWVKPLRSSPLLAALTGVAPDKIPGVGTCDAFKARLVNGPYQPPCAHVKRPADDLKTRSTRHLKDKTDDRHDYPPIYHSQSEALSATLLKEADTPRPDTLQSRMEDLLVTLGLLPSIEQGLLVNLEQLVVSGDGSSLDTAASAHGKPTCNCSPEERKSCGHPRSYTSASAQWAYDANKERDVFGDRYYHLAAVVKGRDLPLLTCLPGGNEADQTRSLKALDDLLKLNHDHHLGLSVKTFCGDMHHDTYAHYDYLAAKQITPIVPLRESSKSASQPQLNDHPELNLDEDGTPRCPGNCRMRHYS